MLVSGPMIPFSTVLTLLMALMLLGCTHEPPRGFSSQPASLEGTGMKTSDPTQKVETNSNGTVKPAKPDAMDEKIQNRTQIEKTFLQWDGQCSGNCKFVLEGLDAHRMYLLTQLEPRAEESKSGSGFDHIKTAKHYECRKFPDGLFQCEWTMNLETGMLAQNSPVSRPLSDQNKRYREKRNLNGVYVQIYESTSETFAPFQIHFVADFETLFRKLGGAEGRTQKGDPYKSGAYIECVRFSGGDKTNPPKCFMYGSFVNGEFAPIQK